ncbi:choline dehydrogenase [Verticillium alfalfae VaMs.102]|uniref:Choline dehydrogenase n=1 Tax=Verticillium alfalfae (strain VaMs.102 / ATCC MYA-4576 / FGSC 10136) TaxID=526221 RepID=C9SY68_VERA1|nr:choline dehydrogenase [Verticillium alfalfae VaMs.102]EEY23733.1 choline dehydrogenase [Verticillium alfalfae VaMs.102]
MKFSPSLRLLAFSASAAAAVELSSYEYVVVGSGAGGGPLAARLALAGHKTLLLEAGDDYNTSNYTVPAYSANASEDPEIAWNFFVHHYANETRQARDYKTTYETSDGEYTGLNPPENAIQKGTLYPRTQALGGCTAHNALIAVYPHQSDFEYIASLTGDTSWSPENMRKYFVKLEENRHLAAGVEGHGYDGWLGTETAPLSIPLGDEMLLSLLSGGAVALSNATNTEITMDDLIAGDANANTLARDQEPGYYQIPLSSKEASRVGPREFILSVRDATYPNGTKKYPLDVRTNAFVTKINFDESSPPRATGVDFLDGKHLYKASPLSTGAAGKPGSVIASREVIVAGGVYNTPQLLKLSGIGPAKELERFDIPLLVDLPGVGTNLQDHYEISVQGRAPANFTSFNGCTFSLFTTEDPCLDRWRTPVGGDHGIYSSSGLAAAMFYKSSTTSQDNFDIFAFGGPVNFRGYFPGYAVNATIEHDWFSWAILKAHPRNTAGTVELRSADPLDVPEITFNYFDTGNGEASKDVQAMTEAIDLARKAFAGQAVPIMEVLPGSDVIEQADLEDYVKDTAWGHHASSTCPIGADDDPFAVLDSSFRVRGTVGLRVVDASVYPRIPGTFTAVSTYMVAEKAADVILASL